MPDEPHSPPPGGVHSIQLRITAEDTRNGWSLSIGKITSFQFPAGNGIRVDTHLVNGHPSVVSADFDSLLAKVIVTASSWQDAVHKAQRALEDTQISGVKTNLDTLRGIVAHPDFLEGNCDTQWLERKQEELLTLGKQMFTHRPSHFDTMLTGSSSGQAVTSANTLFRKGDAWSLTLAPNAGFKEKGIPPRQHHVELARVLRNEFPAYLSADILFSSSSETVPYTMTLTSTSASASAATSTHRRANPSDPSHVSIPFPGKLVEVLVDEGDIVREGDVICVVQQMKMELEVRAPRSGKVTWITEAEDGEEVAEGTLAAVVEREREARL